MRTRGVCCRTNAPYGYTFDGSPVFTVIKLVAIGMFALVVTACDTSSEPTVYNSADSSLSVAIPRIISSVRAIDLDQLKLVARTGDVEVALTPNANKTQWSGEISIPENQVTSLSLTWSQGGLPLARLSQDVGPLTADQTVTLDGSTFNSAQFDDDNDSYSNLFEIKKEELDPNNPAIPGAKNLDVIVPWIPNSDAPTIDGLFDQIWNSSRFRDVREENLAINNLMINQGGGRPENEVEFQWSTLHDGTYLYLFIYGEKIETARLFGDSVDGRDDDAVNIYIDANNSKGLSYDGVDDFHIIIPMLKSQLNATSSPIGNRSGDADTRIQQGANSAPLPVDITFVNCVCREGQHSWEIRINMEELGILPATSFGLEIQLDDDIDGGARDARWGWKHPSLSDPVAGNGDAIPNSTESSPRSMGTAFLD